VRAVRVGAAHRAVARKLNYLPASLLDYNDVIRGRETPVERRARERGATGRPRLRPGGAV